MCLQICRLGCFNVGWFSERALALQYPVLLTVELLAGDEVRGAWIVGWFCTSASLWAPCSVEEREFMTSLCGRGYSIRCFGCVLAPES